MKTLDLFWMRQNSWALIWTGEGACGSVVDGKLLPEELHALMCCCGKAFAECGEPGVEEILEKMKDSEEWHFDESRRPFVFNYELEISHLQIVRVDHIKHYGKVIL